MILHILMEYIDELTAYYFLWYAWVGACGYHGLSPPDEYRVVGMNMCLQVKHTFLTSQTRRIPPLLTFSEHSSSHCVYVGFMLLNLVFCVVLCGSLFVCLSILTLPLIRGLRRITTSDYPFGIFKPCLTEQYVASFV